MQRTSLRRHLGVAIFIVGSLALGALGTRPSDGTGEEPAAQTAVHASSAPGGAGTPSAAPSFDGRRAARAVPAQKIRGDLSDPQKKDIAMRLVSSAENSTLDWTAQYGYIEDIHDGRGYTAGIVGFCTGTGDLRNVVQRYATAKPGNRLAGYLPALKRVSGGASHAGLDPNFTADWRAAAADPAFRAAQDAERDRMYFNPALSQAKQDGLRALGQFIYYDAIVMHGANGLTKLRRTAAAQARPPARGGDEAAYLRAFLDARVALMEDERAHDDLSRVDDAQRVFLAARNFDLDPPLQWRMYGDSYEIAV